ncbi:thiamine pyrophosphate-binding protein [Enterococcus sp. LJL90]
METLYTDEKNVLILISLLKYFGIKKIVASPGATNVTFVGSIQNDAYFEVYSAVDERSAAYIACGLSAETNEAVVLSCTGATASRNYVSGLTEAYYRKLPILAVTSTQHTGRVGHYIPQVIDRSVSLKDTVNLSVQIPSIHDKEDEWAYRLMMNKAILELFHRGGGPVHINLTTQYSSNFTTKELPEFVPVKRVSKIADSPNFTNKKIGIFVGAHKVWSDRLTKAVDKFCESYNAAVICDHTSNFQGKYKINASLVCSQTHYKSPLRNLDVLIHIGEVSGSAIALNPKEVWRVNPDGEVRDTFKKLSTVYEMDEVDFFETFNDMHLGDNNELSYFNSWKDECDRILNKIPELPFSNPWIAQNTIQDLPSSSVLHLGILNSLRSWDFFNLPKEIAAYCNTGGFGIDGCVSSLIGASIENKEKLYFGIVGDLAFFYDMNSIGNRHVGKNIRLMVINNGKGTEFRNYNHNAAKFQEEADLYMAAAGHFGEKSKKLVKAYSENLGFEYMSAHNKEEYLEKKNFFLNDTVGEKPILFEVFTESEDESLAIELINTSEVTSREALKSSTKKIAKSIIGEKGIGTLKNIIKRD